MTTMIHSQPIISDQEIVKRFHDFSLMDLGLTDSEIKTKNKQLFNGIERSYLNCDRHMGVFKYFNVIPRYCFECYKVLITPRNVIELFKLLMIFERQDLPFNNVRKCMVEQRPYCSGSYKGYIYCTGLKEAEQICDSVRQLVEDAISPSVSVSVKRGCSEYGKTYPEYEQIYPVENILQYNEEWQGREDLFDKSAKFETRIKDDNDANLYVGTDGTTTYTREEVLCMQHWLRYAATIGDMSYLNITGKELPPIPYLKKRPAFQA